MPYAGLIHCNARNMYVSEIIAREFEFKLALHWLKDHRAFQVLVKAFQVFVQAMKFGSKKICAVLAFESAGLDVYFTG